MAVADRLRALRERRGWSLAQLAARADLDPTTVWKIENAKTANPANSTLVRIASALGVELYDLTGERPIPRRQPQVVEGAVGLPVLRRRVHAGEPFWGDTEDTVWVPHSFRDRYPRAQVAIVDGECMRPYIEAGEKIIFDPDRMPVNGQMVVVTTEDGRTLLKWFRIDAEGQPYLRSADGDEIRPNGARVEGVVIEVHRGAVRDPEA